MKSRILFFTINCFLCSQFVINTCPSSSCNTSYRTGGDLLTRTVSEGTQDYQTDPSLYPINQPVQKLEALIQCSGEAKYSNDLPAQPDQVFAAFLLSTVHGGNIDKIYKDEILVGDYNLMYAFFLTIR